MRIPRVREAHARPREQWSLHARTFPVQFVVNGRVMDSGAMRFCLRCDGPCRGCTSVGRTQKLNETATRALALLERGNLSPPFNLVAPWLFVGDLRALFAPPPQVTHIASLLDFEVDA